jgi:hypothetical protein
MAECSYILMDHTLKTYMAAENQQLLCNICGIVINSSQAKQHASTSSHKLYKSMLEQELNAIRKESYQNDESVVVSWEKSFS